MGRYSRFKIKHILKMGYGFSEIREYRFPSRYAGFM